MTLILYSYIADLLFGDPQWFPHPVRGIARLVSFLEQRLIGRRLERLSGMLLVTVVVGVSIGCTYLFLRAAGAFGVFWRNAAWVFSSYTTLAVNDLLRHGRAVFLALEQKDIAGAREKLGLIVGRDTRNLTSAQVVAAAVETIAENTSDGIVAPLFYLFIGGPVLAMAYKAVNTLDSMIGHRDEKYRYFGRFAARLDDVMNFIPARISGILISLAAFMLKKDAANAMRIMRRDAAKHPSPNSGVPEAAMAGALNIQLGGTRRYDGQVYAHPFFGDGGKDARPRIIMQAMKISFLSSVLMVLTGVLWQWIF
ncbi:MAG: adenosylcobinamide-phosphate synthase CbiB [Candidatus Omnitrophica bacterium]|nr:adenosylcobinamide-phosphate synthase CbiB [Candidatus Omnitrophota bacterium]